MERFFNTTGPCEPSRHYMLPAERRLPELGALVRRDLYFVVHAARQTGKTTTMRSFAATLRAQGVVALHATIETSQGATLAEAEPRWLEAIARGARADLPITDQPPEPRGAAAGERLAHWLEAWAMALAPRRLVLLLDEVDVVTGEAMVSLLRQLRSGFHLRPGRFPASIALVGMRDLRDYLAAAKDGVPVNPGSPFNIKAESLTLRNFTEAEVGELYAQHAADTGQAFEPAAVARAYYWSQGQPFLANKLGAICMDKLVTDRSVSITAAHVDEAKEQLVVSRVTHLDNLARRLEEPRVAAIVSRVLVGADDIDTASDDFDYCVDLGLLVRGRSGPTPANPIYREVLARQVSYRAQSNLPLPEAAWLRPDGTLDAPLLVDQFLQWWRENSDFAVRNTPAGYHEATVHLAFMAFLQKVVNGGGQVHREFAAGTGRVDLCVELAGHRTVIELKRVVPGLHSPERVLREGQAQLSAYLDTMGVTEGWLIVFDLRPGLTWDERMWSREVDVGPRRLHLRGA
ncbi:MAG: ATP-binding protein [Deltaproteobacteria bacterium]|nr:ATP-binding protein [Deltaproteobacteria bacterium]